MTRRQNPLDRLFAPRTVAVVGASNDERKLGSLVLRNLRAGFAGEIYPVHPTADTVGGLAAYRTLSDIPAEIDLLVPLIPAGKLVDLVRACPPGRVNVLLAIPSGFGEVPPDGRRLQDELVTEARAKGMRVVGPNSVGMMNSGLGLNASLAAALPGGAGSFSVVTQSGGFGMLTYMYGTDEALDVAKLCDLGNTSDISIAEILEYYVDDPGTAVIGAFLEACPDQLAGPVAAAAAEKPFVLATVGRTEPGRRASFAHLGITSGRAWDVPESGGRPIVAKTGLEMLDIAKALSWQPLPGGARVGIVTGSGGVGGELADLCVEHGLTVPELSPHLQKRLRRHLPSYASAGNPVDLTPAWPDYPAMYPPLMEALLESDEIDLLLITIMDVGTTLPELMRAIVELMQVNATGASRPKPVLTYWAAPPGFRHHRQMLQMAHIPCYGSTTSVVRVAAAMSRHARPSLVAAE